MSNERASASVKKRVCTSIDQNCNEIVKLYNPQTKEIKIVKLTVVWISYSSMQGK